MQEKRVLQFLKFRKNLRYKGTQGSTNVSYSYLNMYSLGLNGLRAGVCSVWMMWDGMWVCLHSFL